MTLVDEDAKSILTEYANRAIQGNQAIQVTTVGFASLLVMQVMPSGGQIWNQYTIGASGGKIGNQCQWRHLVAEFATSS